MSTDLFHTNPKGFVHPGDWVKLMPVKQPVLPPELLGGRTIRMLEWRRVKERLPNGNYIGIDVDRDGKPTGLFPDTEFRKMVQVCRPKKKE